MSVNLNTSIGEALDKLSILELKEKYITCPSKLQRVKEECKYLFDELLEYKCTSDFFYKSLVYVNDIIWKQQDQIRHSDPLSPEYMEAHHEIQKYNDARWRMKEKINAFYSSTFREQKSYGRKKLLFFPHQGMGDQLTMIGAVRYLSLFYDDILLVVSLPCIEAVKELYSDDPSIRFLQINNMYELSPNFGSQDNIKKVEVFIEKGYEYKGCLMHSIGFNNDYSNFYKRFYTDLGIPYHIRFDFGHITYKYSDQESRKNRVLNGLTHYIFVHDHRFVQHHDPRIIPLDITTAERRTPKYNNVNDLGVPIEWPPDYSEPKVSVFHPNDPAYSQSSNILDYISIMEDAKEIHIIDSSFYCLAHYLRLGNVERLVLYTREGNFYNEYTNRQWEIVNL